MASLKSGCWHSCFHIFLSNAQENKWTTKQQIKQLISEKHFNPNQFPSLVHRVDCISEIQRAEETHENGTGVEKLAMPWKTFHETKSIACPLLLLLLSPLLLFLLKISAAKLFSSLFLAFTIEILSSKNKSLTSWGFFHFTNYAVIKAQ